MSAKKFETPDKRDGEGLLVLKYNVRAGQDGNPGEHKNEHEKVLFVDINPTLSKLTMSGFHC